MTEWFNKIQYGSGFIISKLGELASGSANRIASNTITMIFNLYGSRLFRIDLDEIIRLNECVDDRDIFYINPIQLRESHQTIGSTSFVINSGKIDGLVISIPWRQMLKQSTEITIDSITLNANVTMAAPILITSLVSTIPYLKGKTLEDHHLAETYSDIYDILTQYFQKVNLRIGILTLRIDGHCDLVATSLVYSEGQLEVASIQIFFEKNLLATFTQLAYSSPSNLTVESIVVDSLLLDHLPTYYYTATPSVFSYTFICKSFVMDDMMASGIELVVSDKGIFLSQLQSFVIQDVALIAAQPIVFANGCIEATTIAPFIIKLVDVSKLMEKIGEIRDKCMRAKCLVQETQKVDAVTEEPTDLVVKNLVVRIVYGTSTVSIKAENIVMQPDKWQSTNFEIEYDEMVIKSSGWMEFNGVVSKVVLTNVDLQNSCIQLTAKSITTEVGNAVVVTFENADLEGVVELVDAVTSLILRLQGEKQENQPDETETPRTYLIQIKTSVLRCQFGNTTILMRITDGLFDLTNQTATDILATFTINAYRTIQLDCTHLTTSYADIRELELHLDPEMTDLLAKMMGTLRTEREEDEDDAMLLLTQSVIAKSVEELDLLMGGEEHQEMADGLNLLEKSFYDLRKVLIDDYLEEKSHLVTGEMVAKIHHLKLHLYDSMMKVEKTNGHESIVMPFMVGDLDEVEFKKISETGTTCRIRYTVSIERIHLEDLQAEDNWSNFIVQEGVNASVVHEAQTIKISTVIRPVRVNIREETLLRFLSFFATSYQLPSSPSFHPLSQSPELHQVITQCTINEISLTINYFPMILQGVGSALSLKDYHLRLRPQFYENTDYSTLAKKIFANWQQDINPESFVKLIPNVKIIQPYAIPIINFVKLVTRYFQHTGNRRKIRELTRNISSNTTMVAKFVKMQVVNVVDYFL